jgi:hypothetical protein
MKRMVFAVIVLLLIGACLPTNLIPTIAPQPTSHVLQFTETITPLDPTQTSTALPTFTPVSGTETSVPPTTSPLPSATETATTAPIPNLTTTPATATEISTNSTALTSTLAVVGAVTVTTTPHKLTYGTLPPEVPFSDISLTNRSKVEAYISLQVTTVEGRKTIIEYPVHGTINFQSPIGDYLYVAWVGGNKMVGTFRLNKEQELSITLYKDRVVIK